MQTSPNNEINIELDLLEHIHSNQNAVHQRDLATIISKSLGMTNSILKRLTEKGLLTIAKVNNRNISYAVTPEGMRELAKRSYRYVKRTIRNVVDFKDAIEAEISKYKDDSTLSNQKVYLVGQSDVEFIIEHLAFKFGIAFQKTDESFLNSKDFVQGKLLFIAEDINSGVFMSKYSELFSNSDCKIVSITSIFNVYLA